MVITLEELKKIPVEYMVKGKKSRDIIDVLIEGKGNAYSVPDILDVLMKKEEYKNADRNQLRNVMHGLLDNIRAKDKRIKKKGPFHYYEE